jgi:hypothetical protein
LISATASCALLVAHGPQTPGEPVQQMKPPTRSLLLAPRRPKARSSGDNPRSAASDDKFLNSKDGGNAGPPGAEKFSVEGTPTPVWHQTKTHPAGGRGIRPCQLEKYPI